MHVVRHTSDQAISRRIVQESARALGIPEETIVRDNKAVIAGQEGGMQETFHH